MSLVLEESASGGHGRGAVSGCARAEAENVGGVVIGEIAAVTFGERGDVGGA